MSRLSSPHGKKRVEQVFFWAYRKKPGHCISFTETHERKRREPGCKKKSEFVYVTQDEVLYTNRIPYHCTEQSKSALINMNTTDNELHEPVRPFWNYPHGIGNPACA